MFKSNVSEFNLNIKAKPLAFHSDKVFVQQFYMTHVFNVRQFYLKGIL
jgi:hypothetical protein